MSDARLSDFVRRRRLDAGLTQADLADRAGLSVETVSALERGLRSRLYPSTARFIGHALGLDQAAQSRLAELSASHRAPDSTPARPTTSAPAAEPAAPRIPLTSLVGRDADVESVRNLLERGTRLLTLTGPGGVGKSRLAVEVARVMAIGGATRVWQVNLSTSRDGSSVTRTVTRAIGEADARSSDPTGVVRGDSRALLVLDGCEAVVADCAELAIVLLAARPSLMVLVTSRERLRVGGETVRRVEPLGVPSPGRAWSAAACGTTTEAAAVSLFRDRATAAEPSFRLTEENADAVANICRRLDGLPLLIEWAAARTRVLSPEQIAARLDGPACVLRADDRIGPDRHRAPGPLVDWSHRLLSPRERALFRRLSVFTGGWTIDAAEMVCAGDGIDPDDVLDLVTSLVDKSLVTVDLNADGVRFRLLKSIRRYAAARLAESGEQDAVLCRHDTVLLGSARGAGAASTIERRPRRLDDGAAPWRDAHETTWFTMTLTSGMGATPTRGAIEAGRGGPASCFPSASRTGLTL